MPLQQDYISAHFSRVHHRFSQLWNERSSDQIKCQVSAAFKVRECRKFVDFSQSSGIFDPFEPLFTFPHYSLVHISILLFILHVIVLVLIVQQRYFNDGGDVLLCSLRFGDWCAALGRSVRLFGRKNAPVPEVRGRATLLLLRQHLLFKISFLDDENGFRGETEGELNLLLPFLFAMEKSGWVHGAGAPDTFRWVLRFGQRQPGALTGTRLLRWAFTLLLMSFPPQIP